MYNYCIETNGSTEMEKEFDSSAYELGADYMYSLIVQEPMDKVKASEEAGKRFGVKPSDLLDYYNSFGDL